MILKMQFEICLEIWHNLRLLWLNIFIKKTGTNYALSPIIPAGTDILDVNIVDAQST